MNAPLDRSGLENVATTFLRHRWATSDRVALAFAHRANSDLDRVGEIDHAVEAATLSEPLRTGSKRNGNALLAAHVRLQTPGAADLRALIGDGKALGHLPVVQGFVWRARGDERGRCHRWCQAIRRRQDSFAAAVRLGRIGAVEAQTVLASGLESNRGLVCASDHLALKSRVLCLGLMRLHRGMPARICDCLRVRTPAHAADTHRT